MLGNVTAVQHFAADPLREHKVLGNHGILPGDAFLVEQRIPVIVSLAHDLIIHGVIQQVEAGVLQLLQFIVILGKETDIKIRGPDIHPAGLGGIHFGEGLLHVFHRVWIFQLVSQLDQAMVNLSLGQPERRFLQQFLASACRQHGERQGK